MLRGVYSRMRAKSEIRKNHSRNFSVNYYSQSHLLLLIQLDQIIAALTIVVQFVIVDRLQFKLMRD